MKRSVALLLLGCAALSAANTYGSGQLRKSLVPIPVPSNYQQRLAASAGAPGVSVGAGAPGSFEGAGAPGAPALEEIEISQPATVYKAPTRVVAQQPIRIAQPAAQYDAPAPPRRGYAGAPAKQVQKEELPEEEELTLDEEDFARNAQYSFASAVDDGIHDNSQIRQETRDGLKVTGTYAYSDGYFKRTVNYEADENGYRVVRYVFHNHRTHL